MPEKRLIDFMIEAGIVPSGYKMPVIVGDAIQQAIDEAPDRVWKIKDFPNLAPPFPEFLVEAYAKTNINGVQNEHWAGFIFTDQTSAIEDTPNIHPATKRLMVGMFLVNNRSVLADYPGMIFVPLDEHGNLLVNCNEQGEPLFNIVNDLNLIEQSGLDKMPQMLDYLNRLMMDAIVFALLTIGMMNCHNVVMVEKGPSPRIEKKRLKHGKLPPQRYYTLMLSPSKAKKRYIHLGEPTPAELQDIKAAHIRRGHWRTYTAERPLMGKPWGVGTFWFTATMVNRDNEERRVDKQYEILP